VTDGGTVASTSLTNAFPAVSLVFTCRDLGPSGLKGSGGIDGRIDGARLTGSFFTIGCGPLASGTVDLTRQQ
jgi:hypothetical protein